MSRLLYVPGRGVDNSDEHSCRRELPNPKERALVENTVAECSCGRLWVLRWVDDDWMGVNVWFPLRWWHRKALRGLRGDS